MSHIAPVGFSDSELAEEVPNLLKYALYLTRSPEDGSDLAQDTMERALRFRSYFTAGTNLGAWLHLMASRLRYSSLRRFKRGLQAGVLGVSYETQRKLPLSGDAERVAIARLELLHAVSSAMDPVFALSLVASDKDLAAQFGISRNAVRARRGRAIRRARASAW